MSDGDQATGMDHAAYRQVVVIKTDEVDGYTYRRGRTYKVDAATLEALTRKGMVEPDTTER